MEKIFLLLLILYMFTEYALRDWKKKHLKNRLCFLPALIALGTAGYGLYQADQQKKKAAKIKPSNYVPPSVNEVEANNRMAVNSTVAPGYARGLEKLGQSTATAVQNARMIGGSAGQVQQAASDADARQKEAVKDLMVNNEQYRLSARQDLNRTLQIKGGYEKQSYDDANAAKSALMGASKQNQYNALTTLGEGLVNQYYDTKAAKAPAASSYSANMVPPSGSGSIRKGDSLGQVKATTAEEHIAQLRARGMNPSYAEEAQIRKQYEAKQFQSGY